MDTTQIVTLISAITAFVTAVGGVIAVFRHVNGPAHNGTPPTQPPTT